MAEYPIIDPGRLRQWLARHTDCIIDLPVRTKGQTQWFLIRGKVVVDSEGSMCMRLENDQLQVVPAPGFDFGSPQVIQSRAPEERSRSPSPEQGTGERTFDDFMRARAESDQRAEAHRAHMQKEAQDREDEAKRQREILLAQGVEAQQDRERLRQDAEAREKTAAGFR